MDYSNKKNSFGMIVPDLQVLIVDDNKMDRSLIRDCLTEMEINVESAHDGIEAVEKTNNNKYDLIFMDQQMPNLSGSEATQEIRKNMNYYSVPIIAITADTSEYTRCLLMYEGTNDCVFKPISKEKIGELIEKWVPKEKIKKVSFSSEESDTTMFDKLEDIDYEAAIQFLGSRKLYSEFISQYVKASDRRILALIDAFNSKDFDKYASASRVIKVSSKQIGAYKLSEFASQMEEAAKNNDKEFVNNEHEKLLNDLQNVINMIKTLNV